VNETYCSRCDVLGHEEDTEECRDYWNGHELPFRDRMYAMVGKVFKLKDPTPELYKEWETENGWHKEVMSPEPGTFVRLTHYTPDTPGMRAGNYWSIQTMDGEFSATQIYQDELEELNALDKLALIEGDDDATG